MLCNRSDAIEICKKLDGVYEDYPFKDPNWTAMRNVKSKKIFALIFERDGRLWINVKSRPEDSLYLRRIFPFVIPAYHMNKMHWNSIIPDECSDDEAIIEMIKQSYELTK